MGATGLDCKWADLKRARTPAQMAEPGCAHLRTEVRSVGAILHCNHSVGEVNVWMPTAHGDACAGETSCALGAGCARARVCVRTTSVGEHGRDGSGYCRGEPSPGSDVARAGAVPMQTWRREPRAGPDVVGVSPCIRGSGARGIGARAGDLDRDGSRGPVDADRHRPDVPHAHRHCTFMQPVATGCMDVQCL